MNFVAHLFLAQPTADSYFGNLLGDFRRGVDLNRYSDAIQAGVSNHIFVDKFTDSHALVRDAKRLVSDKRRRFAGIMLDVLFDHFLLKHWSLYSACSFEAFSCNVYSGLAERVVIMPTGMQPMIRSLLEGHWLTVYRDMSGVERALERTAGRIRFAHNFNGSIEEIHRAYESFEQAFLQFFPQLVHAVQHQAIESRS